MKVRNVRKRTRKESARALVANLELLFDNNYFFINQQCQVQAAAHGFSCLGQPKKLKLLKTAYAPIPMPGSGLSPSFRTPDLEVCPLELM